MTGQHRMGRISFASEGGGGGGRGELLALPSVSSVEPQKLMFQVTEVYDLNHFSYAW